MPSIAPKLAYWIIVAQPRSQAHSQTNLGAVEMICVATIVFSDVVSTRLTTSGRQAPAVVVGTVDARAKGERTSRARFSPSTAAPVHLYFALNSGFRSILCWISKQEKSVVKVKFYQRSTYTTQ